VLLLAELVPAEQEGISAELEGLVTELVVLVAELVGFSAEQDDAAAELEGPALEFELAELDGTEPGISELETSEPEDSSAELLVWSLEISLDASGASLTLSEHPIRMPIVMTIVADNPCMNLSFINGPSLSF
jgi:hypothetical protein